MTATPRSRHVTNRQLTSRQTDCATLAAKGLTSKEIARELHISPSTVDTHIATVLARYNLEKRSDLSAFFQQKDRNENETSLIEQLPQVMNENNPHMYGGNNNHYNPDQGIKGYYRNFDRIEFYVLAIFFAGLLWYLRY